jgi:hypothetical protein
MSDNPRIARTDRGLDGYLENESDAFLLPTEKMAFRGAVNYDGNKTHADAV